MRITDPVVKRVKIVPTPRKLKTTVTDPSYFRISINSMIFFTKLEFLKTFLEWRNQKSKPRHEPDELQQPPVLRQLSECQILNKFIYFFIFISEGKLSSSVV